MDADVVVVGAGIVGLATARALVASRPDRSVVILDKEPAPARHQSGHNSGVIHSGIYYAPGSAKATMVRAGRGELLALCAEHAVPVDLCGKVVVAVNETQVGRLDALAARAAANGIEVHRLDSHGLAAIEPHAHGIAALAVPSAGIVSYPAVAAAIATDLRRSGVALRTGFRVDEIRERAGQVVVHDQRLGQAVRARVLVNCGGLHSDRLAALAGAATGGVRIMPFRGEYYELVPERRFLCRSLVYPVPDPAFPFLGVHLTRMIDGSIHAGPNAVPALRREGYRRRDVDLADARELLSIRTYRLARSYWRTGAGEIHRSLRKRAFVRALQALCPEIRADDLVHSPAGVRAQAIDPSGRLLDDFAFATTPRSVHVINAPSPAATASLAIGRAVADRVDALGVG